MAQEVKIVEAKLTTWGVAENRARLLVQSFIKLGETELADQAKALLEDARLGYDHEYGKVN
jgi:hypothetical protein